VTETSDQAQTRRRWITLAEAVAVAGVIIAALTLYSNWQERREAAAAKQVEAAAETRDKTRFVLRGTVAKDKRAIVLARDETHPLGDIRVTFPAALGVSPQDSVTQTIDADWFDEALRKATDGGADTRTGRLPVLIRYTFFTDDKPTTRQAIYDIVWHTEGNFPFPRKVTLRDLRLRQAGGDQAQVDALWARELPKG
jgi:hypothetical protein